VWCSADGINWENVVTEAPWSVRSWHSVIVRDDMLWLMGGFGYHGVRLNDVWSSTNGRDWTPVTEHAAWSERYYHASAVCGGMLWVAGGVTVDSGGVKHYLNDCWHSADGVNWTQTTSNAPWHVRDYHAMQAYAGSLWILGGGYSEGSGPGTEIRRFQDVWTTTDGGSWVQMPDAPWAARAGHSSVVFDGKLWILGGTADAGDSSAIVNDVWYMAPVAVSIQVVGGTWREEGSPVDLKVLVEGISGPIRYQWLKDGSPVAEATTDMLHIETVAPSDEAVYTCEVKDQYDASFSADAVLIRVFAPGSLPVCGLAACAVMTLGCLLVGWRLMIPHKTREARGG